MPHCIVVWICLIHNYHTRPAQAFLIFSYPAGLEHISAIHRQRYAIEVLIGGHKYHRTRHVALRAWSIRRDFALELLLRNVALLILPTLLCCHLTWIHTYHQSSEWCSRRSAIARQTWCYVVDTDLQPSIDNFSAQHIGQMDLGCLGSIVGWMVLAYADKA